MPQAADAACDRPIAKCPRIDKDLACHVVARQVRAMDQSTVARLADAPRLPTPSQRSGWWLAAIGAATVLMCAPYARTVFWFGDEGVLLHGAEQMLRGRNLYTDLFEFLPPGGFLVTAAWFSLAGISFLSARVLAILTIVGIACLTFLACRRASGNAALSALLTIGWVLMSQGTWTQVSHHYFTTLFSIAAAWSTLVHVTSTGRTGYWPLFAGATAATAALVTPTRGALAMLAALAGFVDLAGGAALIAFILGCALPPAAVIVYLLSHHILVAAIDDCILFAARHYSSIQGVAFGASAGFQNYPLDYLFPVVALLACLVFARDWRGCVRDRRLRTAVAFGIAGFAGCFPRPDVTHIAFAAPLACPLLACCLTRLTARWRTAYRCAAAGIAVALCAPCILYVVLFSQRALNGAVVATPRGDAVFIGLDGAAGLFDAVARTPPQDAYFFYPYTAMLPFLTARDDVSRFDIFTPGYTLASQYDEACRSAVGHAAWVVIDRKWTDVEILRRTFPAMRDPAPPETRRFEQALDASFDLVLKTGTFELRRRRDDATPAACAGIAG
jgi:hypothetical protein